MRMPCQNLSHGIGWHDPAGFAEGRGLYVLPRQIQFTVELAGGWGEMSSFAPSSTALPARIHPQHVFLT